MIAFILYLFAFLILIYFTGFFKLFEDESISRKQWSFLFLGKALAVPVFLYVYTKLYGSIQELDAGKFFHDVELLSGYGKEHPGFLLRLLLGMQDDQPGSADYENILKYTVNWDNGTAKDYLYNDNRVLIRLHLLPDLIAFHSFLVHGLFSCFLSFIGVFFLYKTFKAWFKEKEMHVLLILCFFPSLWFYTGALLKEGLTLFILGNTLFQLKQLTNGKRSLISMIWLLALLCICFLLKPYLLVFSVLCFGLFFTIYYSSRIQQKLLVFFGTFVLIVVIANCVSLFVKHRSLLEAARKHQQRFVGVSKGGIFLGNHQVFIRLNNDSSQLLPRKEKGSYSIRKNISYMYWKAGNANDTLYCRRNEDTNAVYQLAYIIQPGNSNLSLPSSGMMVTIGACFYYTLFYPLFFNARNTLQLVASAENLLIFAALISLLVGIFKDRKNHFLPLVFLFFALALCVLIGFTAPNSGAIFRYRSPAMIFLLMAALYYIPLPKSKFFK